MTPITWNADRERVGLNSFRTRFGIKWWNYLDADGWTKIDLSVHQAGGLFSVSKAPYSLDVPTLANDWAVFQSTNRYDIWQKKEMPDAPVGIRKRYPAALPVPGILTADGILFAGAFPGLNADRLVQLHEQNVRDLVVLRSEPPGNGPILVPIEISPEGLPALQSVGIGRLAAEADFRSSIDIEHGLSFTSGSFRGVKIKAPRVYDSAGRSAPIRLRLRQDGSRLVGDKVIPRKFFEGATYPVYADTVSTFYPDPHPESTSMDGEVSVQFGGPWDFSSLRGQGAGDSADAGSSLMTVFLSAGSVEDEWSQLGRALILFDTSALPNGDAISAAVFGYYAHSKNDDFSDTLQLVGSSPASNNSIDVEDYDEVGAVAYGSAVSLSAITTSAMNTITLNATGRAAISLTGVSKFALRCGKDFNNDSTWLESGFNSVVLRSADESGTATDPYLEVTHADIVADRLAFVQQPTNTSAGGTISPAITVRGTDAAGNLDVDFVAAVTIAIGTNPASGTLSGDANNNASSGIATFNDLSINNAGNGYTLTASSAGLTGATSDAFNITAAGGAVGSGLTRGLKLQRVRLIG
jgi:hypothetical protein